MGRQGHEWCPLASGSTGDVHGLLLQGHKPQRGVDNAPVELDLVLVTRLTQVSNP